MTQDVGEGAETAIERAGQEDEGRLRQEILAGEAERAVEAGTSAYEQLPHLRRKFVDAYIGKARGNAAKAARLAGYSQANAAQQAHRVRNNPLVQAAITERLNGLTVSAEEVLAELTAIVRGGISDFVRREAGEEEGDAKGGKKPQARWVVDLDKAERANALGLVQELSFTAHGPKVKLYSRVEAMVLLARYHGLLKEKVELQVTDVDPLPHVKNEDLIAELRRRFGNSPPPKAAVRGE